MFHNSKSTREKGTLANIRVCYRHKNVLQNTKKCFNATFEFIEFVTTSYIVALAVKYLGVNNIERHPSKMPHKKEEKRMYLRTLAEKVLIFYDFPSDILYSFITYMLTLTTMEMTMS